VLWQISSQNNRIQTHQTYSVLVLPWLSESVMEQCKQAGVGCLGLNGNYHIAFGGFFATKSGAPKPKSETKALQSLFKGKAARVLRAILRHPNKTWTNRELADTAGVSLGMTHKVKVALEERGWIDGLRLTQAEELLYEWRDLKPAKPRQTYYTVQHSRKHCNPIRVSIGFMPATALPTGLHHWYANRCSMWWRMMWESKNSSRNYNLRKPKKALMWWYTQTQTGIYYTTGGKPVREYGQPAPYKLTSSYTKAMTEDAKPLP
jgi:hypothetical protein